MGYNAAVYCNCYKQGLATEPPHKDYVVIDKDGSVNIRTDHITDENTRIEWWLAFGKWRLTACSHRDMDYANERLATMSAMGAFRQLINELGGDLHFPVLNKYLPTYNGGSLPKELTSLTLQEVLQLESKQTQRTTISIEYNHIIEALIRLFRASLETGNPVCWF